MKRLNPNAQIMVLDQARPLVVLCVIVITEITVMERSVIENVIYVRESVIVTVYASGTRDSNGDHSAGITVIAARESVIVVTEEDRSATTSGTIIRQIATQKIADAKRDSTTIVDGLTVTIAIRWTSRNGLVRDLHLSTIRLS